MKFICDTLFFVSVGNWYCLKPITAKTEKDYEYKSPLISVVQFSLKLKMSENSMPPNHLELFVRAGKDGESYGACPFCQRMFMILLLKANAGELTFTVTTVNISKPPPDFKKLSSRLPVVVHGDEVLCDNDEIVKYIDDNFPRPNLQEDDEKATQCCLAVFSKFSFYIKDIAHKPTQLIAELRKIDNYLNSHSKHFLCSEELTHLDCLMLPKLQHIRVVAKAFKNFEIPPELTGLWKYLKNAYECDVFKNTCPSDQEIVYHWSSKPETPTLPKEVEHYYSTDSRYSFDVPKGI